MKKTIILTFLLLMFSLLSDLVMSNTHLKTGTLMNHSFAENRLLKTDTIKIVKNKIKTNSTNVTHIELVENRVLYRNVKGTVYHAVESQTDDTPFITADMSVIDTTKVNELRWVALSRDLLKRKYTDRHGKKQTWNGKIKLGDTIWVDYDKKFLWKASGGNQSKYEKLKLKYEQVKGYWIVHDVMGLKYTLKNRRGEYILDEKGNKQVIQIKNAIDFLQDQNKGMMDVWNNGIIISKRKTKYITLDSATQLAMK